MRDIIGTIVSDNKFGPFRIIDYRNSYEVDIEFLNTGYKRTVEMVQIRRKNVMDNMTPTVYGVGILGGIYPTKQNGCSLKEYKLWQSMLQRVFDENWYRNHPSYWSCEVSNNFKYYPYFYEWCNNQYGFKYPDWQLDKDILIKGNKLYSEDTCVFIPQEINKALTKRERFRGEYPIGVKKQNNLYVSSLSVNGVSKNICGFYSVDEAFANYKYRKELLLKDLANKYMFDLDPRVYQAMINYEVEIYD